MIMFKKITLLALLGLSTVASATNYGPCQIKEIRQSDANSGTASKYMVVKMACPASDARPTCSGSVADTVTFDTTSDAGQLRSSMLMSAFLAKKDVRISTYGACPSDVSNLPAVYGVTVY